MTLTGAELSDRRGRLFVLRENLSTVLDNIETLDIGNPDQRSALEQLREAAREEYTRLGKATMIVGAPQPNAPETSAAGHYAMHDYDCEYPNGTTLAYWREVEDNSAGLDAQVAGHEHVMLEVYHHTSLSEEGRYFTVWQPADAPPPREIKASNGAVAVIPRYDDPAYLQRYVQFIEDLGRQYDGLVDYVVASLGLDGETQFAKSAGGVYWPDALAGTDANAVPYRFRSRWIPAVLEAYAKAFTLSKVLVNMAPGDRHTKRAAVDAARKHGIGIKHSGLLPDAGNHYGYDSDGNPPTRENWDGYGGHIGSWDAARLFPELGLVTESHMGHASAEEMQAMLYAGLAYHPMAMVWHKTLLERYPTLLDWAAKYVGESKETTPGVWWAKHESPYQMEQSGNTGYYSGHLGDWEFWLEREGNMWRIADGVELGTTDVYAETPRGPSRWQTDGRYLMLPENVTYVEMTATGDDGD